jgi:hypothetical protein
LAALLAAVLVGVVHVHHAPSHDSENPFEQVVAAAREVGLDFVVLTEHTDVVQPGPLLAAERAGLHGGVDGGDLLVLVGAEFGSLDGHVIGLDLQRAFPAEGRPGREVIAEIHAQGGFAVVPHPFTYGGWQDWDAPFDALEVQNNASDARRFRGPLFPFWLLRLGVDRQGVMRKLWVRPDRELERWEELLMDGRHVVGLAGADAHQNVSLLGWQLDPYVRMFRGVQTLCPEGPLTADFVWSALRAGHCRIRYTVYEERAAEAREVHFPSGRVELQLDDAARVLEIRNPAVYSGADDAHRPAQ